MSCTESHVGKAKEIIFNEDDLEYKVLIMQSNGFEFIDCYIEDKDFYGPKFIYIKEGDRFFELLEHTEIDEDEDIFKISQNTDGSFNFACQFYNGGGSFEEVFKELVDTLPTPKELTNNLKEDNCRAFYRLEQEGSGYAVTSYCRGKDWKDPKTTELWNNAAKAVRELEDYLKQFKDYK